MYKVYKIITKGLDAMSSVSSDIKTCLELAKPVLDNQNFNQSAHNTQHGQTSVYEHSLAVAYYSYRWAIKLGLTEHLDELVRGALLHDFFLYDWHDKSHSRLHGFHHPFTALKNAKKEFSLSPREQDIIRKHMFPLTLVPYKYKESALVSIVDKFCAAYEIAAKYQLPFAIEPAI